METALTLKQLLTKAEELLRHPSLMRQWVVAELLDVRMAGGHCYMQLVDKDPQGRQQAKVNAHLWASAYPAIAGKFYQGTGRKLESGIKVMVMVSVEFNPFYGLSVNIDDVNPQYTLGDLVMRRNEIINRLTTEGILEMNRRLSWPVVPQRIAVISAVNAAGYGDFFNQLHANPLRLRFHTTLFPAIMQGDKAPASIIAALEQVAARRDEFDGVVIIRGGGATADLAAYEDYDLAAHVAQFPLPVAIGIGHERDLTVLDWVANARLKTPTAVAEWLLGFGQRVLGYLNSQGAAIVQAATDRLHGAMQRIGEISARLPELPGKVVERERTRLMRDAQSLQQVSAKRIVPALTRLDIMPEAMLTAWANTLGKHRQRLDAVEELLAAVSPSATLRRGYSITRVGGRAVTSAAAVPTGTLLETTLADGTIVSRRV